ncbi:hypothetical protein QR680_001734 [Steinernema hermaphroditum]|uniref:Uncharacterized protein n=1 Tax=Steinernema hermaphroditum TaxID=289476 RepID=A0AA39LGS1_9BILA|nr:hypothetical protein QR680_001734 [Steinernema hermaphroditum]
MNVLYQQLLTSFTKQNISDVASSSASKISHPSQLNATTPQLTNMVNIRRSKLPKRGDSRSVIQEDDIDRCREPQTGFRSESRLFYFIDSNGIVKEPTISLSDSQQARLAQFIQDSEKRQQRIREVSRRRAVFAAHRRAAACNLMRGTVDLENVDELLTTDLTKIEAFPSKQMAKDTIRRIHRGVHFMNTQRKNHIEIDKAINNVLSYCFSQNLKSSDRSIQHQKKIDTRIQQARNRLRKQNFT